MFCFALFKIVLVTHVYDFSNHCYSFFFKVVAIKSTFNNIFGLNPDAALPTIVIMALILIFECVGGLNSVALTDTIQAFVMVFSFIAIPLVMKIHYGGWDQLDPETYPKPEFYQTPIIDQQLSFWQFSLINISFFTMPHIMQRFYAAKSVKSLKIAFSVITVRISPLTILLVTKS